MLEPYSDTLKVPFINVHDAQKPVFAKNIIQKEALKPEVLNMLSYIDSDIAYNEWLNVGMALHAGGYPCEVWDNWSRPGKKYQSGICQEKWNTFNSANGITMGTLFHMAKQRGWNGELFKSANPTFISPTELHDRPIPERKWIVKNYLPINSTTALYGDGGTGKSMLAMQMMTCVALGKPWLGNEVMPVKTIGFFCEDTTDELHRRQVPINASLQCQFSDLGNMLWYSGVGEDNILVDYINRKANLTQLYKKLEKKILEFGARLVVIDTAADTYGGDENARGEVRTFVGNLNKLALDINGAILLCAHPSVAGMASGRGDGGNTAWNNTVRSRLYLSRPEKEEADTDKRIFSRKKSNYAKANEDMELYWRDGVFYTNDSKDVGNKLHKQKYAEDHFLSALQVFNDTGRNLSCSKTSGNYAARAIKRAMGCPSDLSAKELESAMERLFDKGIIKNVEYSRGGAKRLQKV